VNHVETVTNDDEGQLVRHLGFLEEILDLLRIVVVALAADPFNLSNLASPGGGLNVLEVYLGIFAEVNDGTQIVVQTCTNRR
jgi:hypothetical protein